MTVELLLTSEHRRKIVDTLAPGQSAVDALLKAQVIKVLSAGYVKPPEPPEVLSDEEYKVYVAGKYQDRDRVRYIHQLLRDIGCKITLDWTNHDIYPNDAAAQKLAQFSQDDVWGVSSANLYIGLMIVPYDYKGLWVEMGIALGKGIPVYIIGEAGDSCIFINHPLVRKFVDIQECCQAVAHDIEHYTGRKP